MSKTLFTVIQIRWWWRGRARRGSLCKSVDAATTTMQVKINSGTYVSLASAATSSDLDLNVGVNTISILLQAQHPFYSRTITISVTRQGIPPPVPVNLTTTPARNSIKLTWDASAGATKCKVYRGTSPATLTLMAGMPITATTYTDNTSVIGTTYYYAVSALEATNAESTQTTATAGLANTPPVVSALSISGNFWVGETLTADYTYTDVDGGVNTSTYIWYRANDAAGAGKAVISGANQKTYTLATTETGKFVSVRVTPNDGISPGTALESGRTVVTVGTLPVKFKFFNAKPNNGSVELSWQTLTEINSLHFIIERNIDGRTWETTSTVNAAGDSYLPLDYSYTDKNPVSGRSFYRLKTIDRDGYTEFSSTVQVDLAAPASTITVYPIPGFNTITVKGGIENRQQIFTISDAEGKMIKKGFLTKSFQQVDIQDLKKGIYFLKVENKEAVRFMKQ